MRSQPEKITRQRGVGLTPTGFRKLNQAKLEKESTQGLRRYTLEHLSEHTGLTPNTLSKIFSSSSPVDRRTLLYCFSAFNFISNLKRSQTFKYDRRSVGWVKERNRTTGNDNLIVGYCVPTQVRLSIL